MSNDGLLCREGWGCSVFSTVFSFFAARFVMAVADGPFIHAYEVVRKRLHEQAPSLSERLCYHIVLVT